MNIILILALTGVYLIPSFIAIEKRNFWAIVALNVLLGWTMIGWVVALIWALMRDDNQTA